MPRRDPPSKRPPTAAGPIHLARSSDGLVVLDVGQDLYSCLYDPRAPESDAGAEGETARLKWRLIDHGVAPAAVRMIADASLPPWEDLGPVEARIRPRDIALFVVALAQAAMAFRRLDFAGLLHHAHGLAPAAPDRRSRSDHAAVARRFERLCLWLPIRIQCLFRSVLLLHFLRLHGLGADWVFGAALFPFEAHCWIADGPRLLAERSDRLLRFAILLRVGAR